MNADDIARVRENAPEELRDLRVWLVWKRVQKKGKPKPDKVPYYADGRIRSGKQGSKEDRDSLVTLDEALAAAGEFDGVGIATLEGFQFVAVDLDRAKLPDGKWKPIAEELLALDTYVELSPSGDGLRALFIDEPTSNNKNPECDDGAGGTSGFELFATQGFVTFTGNVLKGAGKPLLLLDEGSPLREKFEAWAGSKRTATPRKEKAEAEKFDPTSARDLESLADALNCLDADDRETWLKVCFAMGHAFGQRDGDGYRLLTEWASRSRKYDAEEVRRIYFERSRDDRDSIVTLGTVFHMAKEAGWSPLPPDADHYRLAQALVAKLEKKYGVRPVFSLGQFWIVTDGLWEPLDTDRVAAMVGEWFGGHKFCHRGSDFKSVAWLASQEVADEHFFERGAVGIAGPRYFWRVADDGTLVSEPLRPDHRARMRVAAEPDGEGEAPRFMALLEQALDEPQRRLLQCLFGAAITRRLWTYRIAGMLYGGTTTSKTTLLTILKSILPLDKVGATPPQHWDNEYYVAGLAGKVLNIVGELDPDKPIPGGAFKSVVGNDLIEGRHPTHRPFSFVCEAAHFFNCNRLPPTVDKSDAFFVRWRILHFKNRVAKQDIVTDLAETIVREEIGPVLAWMLRGAQMVALDRELPETDDHKKMIEKWRAANNSALQFVLDETQCERGAEFKEHGQTLFDKYREWAPNVGARPFGRNGFYDALEEGGGPLGLIRLEEGHAVVFQGLKTLL